MVFTVLTLGWVALIGTIGLGMLQLGAKLYQEYHRGPGRNADLAVELWVHGLMFGGHLVIAALILRGAYLIVGL